jgi:Asp-tRNA(Asn)/Glu-tRNA(Gln) amidotransferase C subunit
MGEAKANREEIKKQAKKILDNFAGALGNVKLGKKAVKKAHAGGFREERAGAKPNDDFRGRMLANAPNKDENCIIAEKKEWQ